MKQRTIQMSIALVVVAMAAIFVWILMQEWKEGEREIQITLPQDGHKEAVTDAGGAAPELEVELEQVEIMTENVQEVIKTMSRPDVYHIEIKTKNYYGNQVKSTDVDYWVEGTNARIRKSGEPRSNELYWGDQVYLWEEGTDNYTQLPRGTFSMDASAGMLTYESVVEAEGVVQEAGYRQYDETPCIYVKMEDELLGYTEEYYVALDKGLLIYGAVYKEATMIYEMEVKNYAEGVFDEGVFTLPTGERLSNEGNLVRIQKIKARLSLRDCRAYVLYRESKQASVWMPDEKQILRFAVTTEYVDNFVFYDLFDIFTSGFEILSGIEVIGMLVEILTDCSGHSKAQVRVNINLTNRTLSSLAELFFRDTDSIWHFTAIVIDHFHKLLRNGRGAVQNDGEAGQTARNFFQNIKTKRRRN